MKNDTKIIFVGNYKGGVGKTTTVLNFAEYFEKMNHKTLVLDLDPQSSLSEILVKNNGGILKDLEDEKTLNYVFDLNICKIQKYNSVCLEFDKDIVQHYEKGNFDFIASSLFYREDIGLDRLVLKMQDNVEYLSILKIFLDSILRDGKYDYVLIDCPPSNNLITQSAFLNSDYYIIPTVLDGISSNGVAHYINTVRNTYNKYCIDSEDAMLVRHYFGAKPRLIGIFCTFIRGQVNYESELGDLKRVLQQNCKEEELYLFKEQINNYIDISRSNEIGEASKARKDYQELSENVIKRIGDMEQC
ncbi:MAG: AAA family ATPase [Lachnospiraceae bacterium]|nr:AAA family ATPase [Lachnospiraceae bacterium]